MNKAPRFWFSEYEWPKWQFFDKGNDEFLRKTFVIRLPFERAFVIPYKDCGCKDCDVARESSNGYRLIKSDTEGDETLVDYLIDVHRFSGNRLPLSEYLGWTDTEVARYYKYGIVPVE